MSDIEKAMTNVRNAIDELVEQATAMEPDQFTPQQGDELVKLEQYGHDKFAIVFDKFDIEIGDERVD
jgi:hypothetical protein